MFCDRYHIFFTVFAIVEMPLLPDIAENGSIVFAIGILQVFAACLGEHPADVIGCSAAVYGGDGEPGGIVVTGVECFGDGEVVDLSRRHGVETGFAVAEHHGIAIGGNIEIGERAALAGPGGIDKLIFSRGLADGDDSMIEGFG